jgi:hypothetical protein
MLVYGDRQELADSVRVAREINSQRDAVERMAAGLDRHARLTGMLVEAGRLLQGIADGAFAREQRDACLPEVGELSAFLLHLARALCRSWDSGFQETGELPRLHASSNWPSEVELREPEGFAFYALYPEAYADAARRLRLGARPRVIGIRSIGTSLAAVVAAALNAPPPVTVRPFGDPSDRKVALDAALERELLGGDAHYVIVDEGPGQSGGSFAAVADWLQAHGVPLERIALLPSHAGPPGPAATEERRRWWRNVQRQVADFGDQWPALIERWCSSVLGPLGGPPRDISGGAWRALHFGREEDWPGAVPSWERRKFLVSAGGARFVAKFAGAGTIGEEKMAVARTLAAEGLTPEPVGLAHGFLIERWCEGASPLRPGEKPIRDIARYTARRAQLLPAIRGSGASVGELLTMARRNISLEFGEDAARALEPWERGAGDLDRRVVRVRTDNRLDPHEWLRTVDGAPIKTDALDHHRAHDLVGCQDIAWDVAGAVAEFDLDQYEADELVRQIEEHGVRVDAELLTFCRVAYLAFRLGQARLGATMVSDPREHARVERRADAYAAQLQHLLEGSRAATRPDSLVG